MPVLAAAVGIYLPLELTVPIFLGGLLAWLLRAHAPRGSAHDVTLTATDAERMGRKGMLFAAGVITGEALMGIAIAVPIYLTKNAEVLALPQSYRLGEMPAGEWAGLVVLALIAWWLYRTATSRGPMPPAAPART